MTQLQALSPNGYTLTLTCHPDEVDQLQWILDADKWLKANGFTALPVPKSGNWNKDGKPNTPRNWVEAVDSVLHVYIAYTESKEKTAELKKEWASKIKEATGLGYEVDSETWKDDKGRAQWTFTYPIKVGRELLAVLPEDLFERKATLKARLEAAAKK